LPICMMRFNLPRMWSEFPRAWYRGIKICSLKYAAENEVPYNVQSTRMIPFVPHKTVSIIFEIWTVVYTLVGSSSKESTHCVEFWQFYKN
jgi:hypothetical protein